MKPKIYLFPDTNLFIQCKPLQELDWSKWKENEEVCLIISRPVQSEIDGQKDGGNSRLAKRARKTSSMLRKIITSDEKYLEVQSSKPPVRLYIKQGIKPDEALSEQLTYDEKDDQLVGVVSSFSKSNPGSEVFLLTHDTGPMASADMVGIKFIPIPDEWLMAPESSESDKEISKLKSEISRLRKNEPDIIINFDKVTVDGSELNNIVKTVYSPLTEEQVSSFLEIIAQNIPIEKDFGSKEQDKNMIPGSIYERAAHFGLIETYVPATEKEISFYNDKQYPEWLEACRIYLQNCHDNFNKLFTTTRIEVPLSNIGTRPAEDTLVTIVARGDFYICPPPFEEEKEIETPSLPLPPRPPRGEWRKKDFLFPLSNHQKLTSPYGMVFPSHDSIVNSIHTSSRSDNTFYYQNRPERPVQSFSLECKQWRHQSGERFFQVDLFHSFNPRKISGALEVNVHASNKADPLSQRIPIKIEIKEVSVYESAEKLVNMLIHQHQSS